MIYSIFSQSISFIRTHIYIMVAWSEANHVEFNCYIVKYIHIMVVIRSMQQNVSSY